MERGATSASWEELHWSSEGVAAKCEREVMWDVREGEGLAVKRSSTNCEKGNGASGGKRDLLASALGKG